MKKNQHGLNLLDDSIDTEGWDATTNALVELTRQAATVVPAKAALAANAAKTVASPTHALATRLGGGANRVFTSSPTLRQMMREYNRPLSRPTPIMRSFAPRAPQTQDFRFDKVDLIRMPHIPGKILRPARSDSSDPNSENDT